MNFSFGRHEQSLIKRDYYSDFTKGLLCKKQTNFISREEKKIINFRGLRILELRKGKTFFCSLSLFLLVSQNSLSHYSAVYSWRINSTQREINLWCQYLSPADEHEASCKVHPLGRFHKMPDRQSFAETYNDIGCWILIQVGDHCVESCVVGGRQNWIFTSDANTISLG